MKKNRKLLLYSYKGKNVIITLSKESFSEDRIIYVLTRTRIEHGKPILDDSSSITNWYDTLKLARQEFVQLVKQVLL